MEHNDQEASNAPASNDIEQDFLTQFSSMVTSDKEELINQFLTIGASVNSTTATFFLDMNNWNLQAAVGCYFDFMAQNRQPMMKLLKDITVGRNEKLTPNTAIKLTWVLLNNGDMTWPSGTYVALRQDPNTMRENAPLTYEDLKFYVPAVRPSESVEVSVQLVSPSNVGMFETVWSIYSPNGTSFGENITSRIEVSLDGTMSLTQQMNEEFFTHDSSSNVPPPAQSNEIDDSEMWG